MVLTLNRSIREFHTAAKFRGRYARLAYLSRTPYSQFEKITKHMQAPAESAAEKSEAGPRTPTGFAKLLWQRLVELWISLVILAFFLIRVLGSHTIQRLLGGIAHRHLP
jgi:hypothetical protein